MKVLSGPPAGYYSPRTPRPDIPQIIFAEVPTAPVGWFTVDQWAAMRQRAYDRTRCWLRDQVVSGLMERRLFQIRCPVSGQMRRVPHWRWASRQGGRAR